MSNADGNIKRHLFSPVGVNQITFIGGDGDDRFENLTEYFVDGFRRRRERRVNRGSRWQQFPRWRQATITLIGNVGIDNFSGE